MPEPELDQVERELSALGSALRWSPTPDLTASVLSAVAQPTPIRTQPDWRRWLAAAAIVVLLIGGLLATSSSARHAVADFLGIDGLRIERGHPDTTAVPNPVLGTPTSLQDFERWLPFVPREPAALGAPDALYLRVLETGQFIGISAWDATDTLPEAAETGYGAVLMQFSAPGDAIYLLKTLDLREATVVETEISGAAAYWVEGVTSITVADAAGLDSRPSANVLIWQQNGIGFRFESALSMEDALAIAETMEPLPSS